MADEDRIWKCAKCDRRLEKRKTVFSYLGHTVAHQVYACPGCGNVFIPEELAEGRMSEIEQQMEDK